MPSWPRADKSRRSLQATAARTPRCAFGGGRSCPLRHVCRAQKYPRFSEPLMRARKLPESPSLQREPDDPKNAISMTTSVMLSDGNGHLSRRFVADQCCTRLTGRSSPSCGSPDGVYPGHTSTIVVAKTAVQKHPLPAADDAGVQPTQPCGETNE